MGVTDPIVAIGADGADRELGRRGRETRRRLLDATIALLDSVPYRELRVVDIAREAGTSPATFYQYFGDVEDAVLVVAEQMVDDAAPRLAAPITNGEWVGDGARATASAVADVFIEIWDRYRPVLRVMDLATDEGDLRFRALRTRLLGAPAESLVELAQRRDPSLESGAARADAGALVSMLAHVSAHRDGLVEWGATPEDLRRSLARILVAAVGDQEAGSLPES